VGHMGTTSTRIGVTKRNSNVQSRCPRKCARLVLQSYGGELARGTLTQGQQSMAASMRILHNIDAPKMRLITTYPWHIGTNGQAVRQYLTTTTGIGAEDRVLIVHRRFIQKTATLATPNWSGVLKMLRLTAARTNTLHSTDVLRLKQWTQRWLSVAEAPGP